MADVKKIATRESYGNALVEVGKKNPNVIVLDADLANATKTNVLRLQRVLLRLLCQTNPNEIQQIRFSLDKFG